jgi:hypothetical protein
MGQYACAQQVTDDGFVIMVVLPSRNRLNHFQSGSIDAQGYAMERKMEDVFWTALHYE